MSLILSVDNYLYMSQSPPSKVAEFLVKVLKQSF